MFEQSAAAKTSLGEKIRRLRLARGMTQEELAGREYTRGFVSAVESGRTGVSNEALELFARRLGVPVAVFRLDDQTFQLELARVVRDLEEGRLQAAREALERLLERETVQPRQEVIARRWLARALLAQGDVGYALEQLGRALVRAEQVGDREERVRLEALVGEAHFLQDQIGEAIQEHEACLRAVESGVVADPTFALALRVQLAAEYERSGDPPAALAHYEAALALAESAWDLGQSAALHWRTSRRYREAGNHDAALRHALRARAHDRALAKRRLQSELLTGLGRALEALGEPAAAEERLREAVAVAAALEDSARQAAALASLVGLLVRTGAAARALDCIPELLAVAECSGQALVQGAAQLAAAEAYAAAGQYPTAEPRFREAIARYSAAGRLLLVGRAHFAYANAAMAAGQTTVALEQFRLAYQAARSGRMGRFGDEP